MKLHAILFDLGGTLLHYHDPLSDDLQRPFRRITQVGIRRLLEALAHGGVSLPPPETLNEAIDRHIGQEVRAATSDLRGGSIERPIRAALAELGIPLDEAAWEPLRPHFYAAIDSIVSPRVGAAATLATLREQGFALGLISNTYWAADLHDRHLAEHDLLDLLPVRVYSSDWPHAKPHPSIFAAALERLKVPAAAAVYVGDRPDVDVGGAQAAGMRGILIRSPHEHTPPGAILPDAVVDELPDLIPALARLGAGR